MKRSKMLDIIVAKLESMREGENGFYVYPEDEIIANLILKTIEEAGMLPPLSDNKNVFMPNYRDWD